MTEKKGRASVSFGEPPRIIGAASIVGSKEGDGPLGHLFDVIEPDPRFGKNTWEEAESELQLLTARKAMEKAGMNEEQIRYLFAGDLLAQGIATSYGIMELQIPLFGLYGACSTCGESLSLASMAVNAGCAATVSVSARAQPTRMPRACAAAHPPMWSKCPCVSNTASTASPRRSASRSGSSPPQSMSTADAPSAVTR